MPFDEESKTTASPADARPRSKRRIALLLLLLLCVLLAAVYPSTPAPAPPVTLLPASYKIILPPTPWPDSWIPPSWGWLWRVRYSILGYPKSTVIGVQVFQINSDMGAVAPLFGLRAPVVTGPGGVCAWAVSNADTLGLVNRVKAIPGGSSTGASKLTTDNWCAAKMFVGSSFTTGGVAQPVGLTAEFLPCLINGIKELTCVLKQTETAVDQSGVLCLHTNFAAVARLRVSDTAGVVLIDALDPLAVRNRTGLIISVQAQAR